MKKLKLTIAGKSFYAKLLTEQAPKTVSAIVNACPFESKLLHAKICDNEIFFHAPINIDEKENPVYSEPGHIAFFNFRQTVCIWYDEMVPLGFSNLFAVVEPEDLPGLAEEARKVWDRQGGTVRIEIVDS